MNWAKKLLQPKDIKSFTLPSHDCPRCGGRLIDEGDTVHCDTCDYPEPEDGFDEEGTPVETDEPTCDVCDKVLGSEYPTCPVCGVALCSDKECADEHIAEHHPDWDEDDEDDEDDEPPGRCDDCERDGDCGHCHGHPGATTTSAHGDMPFMPVKPMTELDQAYLESSFQKDFCRAAFIDAFGYRYVLRSSDGQEIWPAEDGSLWALTNDLEWVKLAPNWRIGILHCAHCGKPIDGPRYVSSRHPELKFCSHQCCDDYVALHS